MPPRPRSRCHYRFAGTRTDIWSDHRCLRRILSKPAGRPFQTVFNTNWPKIEPKKTTVFNKLDHQGKSIYQHLLNRETTHAVPIPKQRCLVLTAHAQGTGGRSLFRPCGRCFVRGEPQHSSSMFLAGLTGGNNKRQPDGFGHPLEGKDQTMSQDRVIISLIPH